MTLPATVETGPSPQPTGTLIRRTLARTALFSLVSIGLVAHFAGRLLCRLFGARRCDETTVVAVGTFYNKGWFDAHAVPLCCSDAIDRVIVVTDESIDVELKKLLIVTPSRAQKRFGRMIARLLTLFAVTWRYRPALIMGYHIMPNALCSLVVARLMRTDAAYQMTGGPVQIQYGGCLSENPLLAATGSYSRAQERLMIGLCRAFDLVVVRGQAAKRYVRAIAPRVRCRVITGAIDTARFRPVTEDDANADPVRPVYDLICVGRLVDVKRVDRVIELARLLRVDRPSVRVAIAGDGPLRETLEAQAHTAGLTDHVDFLGKVTDVAPLLRQSRCFILLSDNEGMSIAMLEAMAAGVVPIVPDIGDLSDAVITGTTGLLLESGEPTEIAADIARLFADESALAAMALHARERIVAEHSIEVIAQRWRTLTDRRS